MLRSALGRGILCALALCLVHASVAAARLPCSGNPSLVHTLRITVDGVPTYGYYVLPHARAQGLVVVEHGYQRAADSEVGHLLALAQNDGVIGVAMDYHGQTDLPPAQGSNLQQSRGWRVQEGADDSVAAARAFDRSCRLPTIDVIGISMGGNTSGLAVAAHATRRNGRPLFDYWVDVEGVTNVTETYEEAAADAKVAGSTYSAQAAQDIEQEMGGTPGQAPDAYRSHTVVTRAADIKASGLKGVVLVHGAFDGTVPSNQTREMASALRGVQIPSQVFTVLTRGSGEPGSTLDGGLLGSVPGYVSPFAGHGSESSFTQLVIDTGYARLDALLRRHEAPTCDREYAVDGDTGTATPSPSGC